MLQMAFYAVKITSKCNNKITISVHHIQICFNSITVPRPCRWNKQKLNWRRTVPRYYILCYCTYTCNYPVIVCCRYGTSGDNLVHTGARQIHSRSWCIKLWTDWHQTICGHCSQNISTRTTWWNERENLYVPKAWTNVFKNSIVVNGAHIWDELDQIIRKSNLNSLPLRRHVCIMFLTRKQWRTMQWTILLNVLLYLLIVFILFYNLSIY